MIQQHCENGGSRLDVAHRQGGGVAGQGGVEGAVVRGKEERRVTDDTLIHPAGIKKKERQNK